MKLKPWVLWVGLIISIIPIVAYFALYPQLPDQIATKFGFDGTINDYTAKQDIWFLMVLPLILMPLFYVLPRMDPKGDRYEHFRGFYQVFVLVMPAFLAGMALMTLFQSITENYQYLSKIVTVFIAILFLVIGNYMPKFKQNYTMGIKTPWTLANEVVWYKTHRLGGKCFMVGGVLCLIGTFLTNWLWLFIAAMVVISLVPMAMSYVYYRQETK